MAKITFTLSQFEQIDGLLDAVQRRPDLPENFTREQSLAFMRPEWRLHDALADLLGIDHVQKFTSAEECAADFVTRCLTSASLVGAA